MKNSESRRDGTREDRKRTERAGASKDSQFFELAEQFCAETDPERLKRLGDELGRLVFGNRVGEKQIPRGLPRCRSGQVPPARNDKK